MSSMPMIMARPANPIQLDGNEDANADAGGLNTNEEAMLGWKAIRIDFCILLFCRLAPCIPRP